MAIFQSSNSNYLKGIFSQESTVVKALVSILFWLICTGTFSALGTIIYSLCDESITGQKWLQFFSALGSFVLAPVGMTYLISKHVKEYLSLHKTAAIFYVLAILCLCVSTPLINHITFLNEQMVLPDFLHGLEELLKSMEEKNGNIAEQFLSVDSFAGFLANIIILALIPAIGEELLFRGFIQKGITNLSHDTHVGIWVAGILFSAIHLQFYGFFPRMIMGVLFGYLLVWSRSILVPMAAHFFNNATIVCIRYFYNTDESITEELGRQEMPLVAVSLILTIGICYRMLVLSQRTHQHEHTA